MLLGRIYEMQQQYDLSEKHYRDALKINPDFAPAANNLAYLLTEQNKSLDEALMLAKKAKEKLYDDPSVMDTLGWIYFKKGLYDSAIVEFNDSLQKQPDNSEVHYHLGMAYYKKGETPLAKKELENALNLNKNFKGSQEAEEILNQMN
jgi:tetratricopeptide (TPR) repeat protein